MSKYTITSGVSQTAKKIVVYGAEGIGKSSFASKFPGAVFIDCEGSTAPYNFSRLPRQTSWEMLKDEAQEAPNMGIQTLVIDTADWAEKYMIQSILDSHGKKSIEDFGYGNGYRYLFEEWGRFLNILTEVVNKGVNVVLLAHAAMRKFEQPEEMGAYDRWEMKLTKTPKCDNCALTKEWADMVLFANYKVYAVAQDKDGKKHKAQGGRRVMYTSHHACWDAKNRYGLPEECEFSYDAIRHVIENGQPQSTPQPQSVPQQTAPKAEPVKATEAPKAQPVQQTAPVQPTPAQQASNAKAIDQRIPQALRDLMSQNGVDEWDIQNVVSAKGYFPADMQVADYPQEFIMGVLVGAWAQVFAMITEAKKNMEVPFN